MNPEITVIDNFLPLHQANWLRRRALKLDFETKELRGVKYPGVGIFPIDFSTTISRYLGRDVIAKPSFFRMHRAADEDAQVGWIHSDDQDATFAGVLYLTPNEHCRGGTAFWKHEASRQTSSTPDQLMDLCYCLKMNEDGLREELWEQADLVLMQFNRFITYPTRLFHSRYPKQCWGETKETARLVCPIFYDLA